MKWLAAFDRVAGGRGGIVSNESGRVRRRVIKGGKWRVHESQPDAHHHAVTELARRGPVIDDAATRLSLCLSPHVPAAVRSSARRR